MMSKITMPVSKEDRPPEEAAANVHLQAGLVELEAEAETEGAKLLASMRISSSE
jgi:hypothetical protein